MEKNARAIIARIIEKGGTTIPDIAELLEISIGTATKEIAGLQKAGLVVDSGKVDTGSGRKPRRFTLNPEGRYYAGVDLNDKYISFGLMDMAGNMIRTRTNVVYKLENTPAALHALCEIMRSRRALIPQYYDDIRCVCINIPGRVNMRTGYSHTNFNFTNRPLAAILSEALKLPFILSNDTHAMAYAEYLKGGVDQEKNIIFVNANWGLGIGLILDGRLYFGKSGYAGEFGHVHAYDNQIICRCGKKGCLETEVSGQALRRKLTERIRHGESSILSERILQSDRPLSQQEIQDAVQREDTLTIEVIGEIGERLGVQVAGLMNIFNPELVILGGELATTGGYLLQPLKTAIQRHTLNQVARDTDIRLTRLGEDAGVIGACLMARSHDLGLL